MFKYIGEWMLCNKLKLNQEKTELLVISTIIQDHPLTIYKSVMK